MNRLMSWVLVFSLLGSMGGMPAIAEELSLDDLGFKDEQLKSDPTMQATLHKRRNMI